MRENKQTSACSLCLDYISGVCTDKESRLFERHLPGCADCQAEIDELRIVWEALPENMERFKLPTDLKKQVMDATLAADNGYHAAVKNSRVNIKYWKSIGILVAFAASFLLGFIWNDQLQRERIAPLPIEQALDVPAASIERLVSLKPEASDANGAYGVACIVDNGLNKQFIVYVFGAQSTIESESYQVWLMQNGERTSAGTFRVDETGIGVLAMPIGSSHLSFESVGITLEPDDRGNHPRGDKKFGSL